jgi:hypothetical protein
MLRVSVFSLERELLEKSLPAHLQSAALSNGFFLFLWGGEPYSTAGDARRDVHWSSLGSSLGLANDGNHDSYAPMLAIAWTSLALLGR